MRKLLQWAVFVVLAVLYGLSSASCAALAQPLNPVNTPPGTPLETPGLAPVTISGGDAGTVTITPGPGLAQPRPTTVGDVAGAAAGAVIGATTGNPPLALLATQLFSIMAAAGAAAARKGTTTPAKP